MTVFAYKIIKEPPDCWEVEVSSPVLWRGRFRSQDGIAWWSPVLERPLGEHNENPGEAGVLRNLQAIARNHETTLLLGVVAAARALVARIKLAREAASGNGWNATDEMQALCGAIEALDDGKLPIGHMPSGAPLYVGDDYPRIAARYEPTEETDEP